VSPGLRLDGRAAQRVVVKEPRTMLNHRSALSPRQTHPVVPVLPPKTSGRYQPNGLISLTT
jgi:hypothetical protein